MFHTHVAKYVTNVPSVSNVCCIQVLQVQTAGIGVHEDEQGQAATTGAWRRRRAPLAV
jgi:hypothetical protein